MWEIERIEKAIIGYLQDSINGEIFTKRDKNLTNKQMIGYGLSYYLAEILREQKDSTIEDKWLDDVAWENFELFPPNKMKGSGNLWWGVYEDNSSKTFPEDFYCELELINLEKETTISYLFQFQINGKRFILKKENV